MATLIKAVTPTPDKNDRKRHILNSVLVTIGYILSPLSWWNDMVVNVPLAYVFSIPFTLIKEQFFLPAFIVGYWLTNVIGFFLLQKGIEGLASDKLRKWSSWRAVRITLVYTAIIALLVWFEWLPTPVDLIEKIK